MASNGMVPNLPPVPEVASESESGQFRTVVADFDFDDATLDGDFGVGLIIETIVDGSDVSVSVKDVVAHGSADRDGRVQKGDKIISVDGHRAEIIVTKASVSNSLLGKYLKGPSGTTANIEIQKAFTGQMLVVSLKRSNAGYWALYDSLHMANINIVSLKRELADAQVAVVKANDVADLARAEKAAAEECARTESRAKTDLEFKVKSLQKHQEALYKELEMKDQERVQLSSRARKAEGELGRSLQETKVVEAELEIERARCAQALEREARDHKNLADEIHLRRMLEKELDTVQASLVEANDWLGRNKMAAQALPKFKARAEDAEIQVEGLKQESESLMIVLAGLQEEMKELRASEAKYSSMVSAGVANVLLMCC
jgi:hypothetical protein